MTWWGKLIGGTLGFMLGGPLGALLGAALGHGVDKRAEGLAGGFLGGQQRVQMAFFTATFSVMGHLAKADGRVSEREIQIAQTVMDQMRLPPAMERLAKDLYRQGKQPDFDLDAVLDQFRGECRNRPLLLRIFLEILIQTAYADGAIHPSERRVLLHVCDRLGVARREFERLEGMVRATRGFQGPGAVADSPEDLLARAYEVLGISPQASDAEVKKAYRRLINQHHPDKLVAKGLPQEMMKLAQEKTREIRQAYERIREARGFR